MSSAVQFFAGIGGVSTIGSLVWLAARGLTAIAAAREAKQTEKTDAQATKDQLDAGLAELNEIIHALKSSNLLPASLAFAPVPPAQG